MPSLIPIKKKKDPHSVFNQQKNEEASKVTTLK